MVLFKMVAATDSFRNTLQKSHIFLNASLVHAIPLHEIKCDIQVNSLHKPSHSPLMPILCFLWMAGFNLKSASLVKKHEHFFIASF